jgi:hypothetical protein
MLNWTRSKQERGRIRGKNPPGDFLRGLILRFLSCTCWYHQPKLDTAGPHMWWALLPEMSRLSYLLTYHRSSPPNKHHCYLPTSTKLYLHRSPRELTQLPHLHPIWPQRHEPPKSSRLALPLSLQRTPATQIPISVTDVNPQRHPWKRSTPPQPPVSASTPPTPPASLVATAIEEHATMPPLCCCKLEWIAAT